VLKLEPKNTITWQNSTMESICHRATKFMSNFMLKFWIGKIQQIATVYYFTKIN